MMNTAYGSWKVFAACALPLIPVLIRQTTAVTRDTEAAAFSLTTKLKAISGRATRQADDAMRIVEQAARGTGTIQIDQLRASVERAKQQAGELSDDVNQIVMTLQFQDITRQKLEHVERALTHLRDHLQHLIDGTADEGCRTVSPCSRTRTQLHHGSGAAGSCGDNRTWAWWVRASRQQR